MFNTYRRHFFTIKYGFKCMFENCGTIGSAESDLQEKMCKNKMEGIWYEI